ncbi:MAG: hypothetical protein HY901_07630 [Deltaproteobacteria bacterium]|nr:hypothetical protein [Deltaproteobacteria bacterium]
MRSILLSSVLWVLGGCANAEVRIDPAGALLAKAGGSPVVFVLGAVHDFHEKESFGYSYSDLSDQIVAMQPNLVCGEVTVEDHQGAREAMYPWEIAVVEKAAELAGAKFWPADWRPDLASMQTVAIEKEMSPEEKKAFSAVYSDFMPKLMASGRGSFEFWHSKETQAQVRAIHDRMIHLGTEAAAGFWETRNQIIVKRCLRKALETGAQRVLFVFGAEHKYVIEDYVRRFYGIEPQAVVRLAPHGNRAMESSVLERWSRNRDGIARLVAEHRLPEDLERQFSKTADRLSATIEAKGLAR